jgi:hypothetical protein
MSYKTLALVVSRKLTDVSEVLAASIISVIICDVWSVHDNAKISHFELSTGTELISDALKFLQSLISVTSYETATNVMVCRAHLAIGEMNQAM